LKINIKPLSVNCAFQGRRFKTPAYKQYERDVTALLRPCTVPEGNIHLTIEAGFSRTQSDIDNIAKPFIDILQKKYGFNDSRIYKLTLIKQIVKKGSEYLDFEFEAAN
jgi:Holliday junction resolvase RusA-like endonuclease